MVIFWPWAGLVMGWPGHVVGKVEQGVGWPCAGLAIGQSRQTFGSPCAELGMDCSGHVLVCARAGLAFRSAVHGVYWS
jgi:hypothetical protein